MSLFELHKGEVYKGNILVFKNKKLIPHRNIIKETIDRMKIPDDRMKIPDNSTYFYFDDKNPEKASLRNKLGICMNVESYSGNVDCYPEYIAKIFKEIRRGFTRKNIHKEKNLNNLHKYFIWLAERTFKNYNKKVLTVINFLWNLIHELQHLKQKVDFCEELFYINSFFKDCKTELGITNYMQCPIEYDAEKRAKEIITDIFKSEKCDEFIKINEEDIRFKIIKGIDVSDEYNPELETLKILCANIKILKEKQTEIKESSKVDQILKLDFDNILENQKICIKNE